MVSVELLAAVDALLWLRTGDRAAAYLQCTQSTVSRHSRRCLEVFGLQMTKRDGEWCLLGDTTLLEHLRSVHQLLRWREGSGLRLDGQPWCHHLLAADLPDPWTAGNGNAFEHERLLQLLRSGVIDAWLCSAADLPEHPDLHAVPFTSMPLQLVLKRQFADSPHLHTLLGELYQRSQQLGQNQAGLEVLTTPEPAAFSRA